MLQGLEHSGCRFSTQHRSSSRQASGSALRPACRAPATYTANSRQLLPSCLLCRRTRQPCLASGQHRWSARTTAAAAAVAAAPEAAVLSFSQLYDKQVVTQSGGKQLGFVDTAFVDPRTLALVCLGLKAKPAVDPFAGQRSALQLASLGEIGDVVLLQKGSPLPTAEAPNDLMPIFETDIEEANGRPIGRVVDFRFNPSTGQVCSLIYDKTSLPLPRFAVLKLVDLWSTGAQHVASVDSARLRITLKPGHRTVRKSAGWLEWVFSRLQDIWRDNDPDGDQDGLTDDDFYLYFQEQRARGSTKTWGQAWVDFCYLQQAVQEQQRSSNPANSLAQAGRKAVSAAADALDTRPASGLTGGMQRDPRLRRTDPKQMQQRPLSLPPADSSRDIGQWQRRQDAFPEQRPSKVASIPIIRQSEPFERRDADGGFGQPPPPPPEQAEFAEQPRFTEWASPSARRQELEYLEARGPGGVGSAGQRGRQTSLDFQQQQQQQQLDPRGQPGQGGRRSFQQQQGQQPPQGLRQQTWQSPQQPSESRGQQLQQPQTNEVQSGFRRNEDQDDEDDLEERVARIFRQR
ncbi:hypothetical protein WJX74_007723 [Apatococcus lobatus]|uniref:PRC-barrel domain-containing protein n=1 Tax=Apatococcus lobatus TaxID=904363 RepID=A0AAW1SCP3_9CHLO